jgi:hypothetical protein
MVFLVVFDLRDPPKRERVGELGGLPVGDSAILMDRSETSPASLHAWILSSLASRLDVEEDEVVAEDEAIYVVPLGLGIAGRGPVAVDSWIARRGLLRAP